MRRVSWFVGVFLGIGPQKNTKEIDVFILAASCSDDLGQL